MSEKRRLFLALLFAGIAQPAFGSDNLVSNGEFAKNADGWTLIDEPAANWQAGPPFGCNGQPGWFWLNGNPKDIPVETSQLITGLSIGQSYLVAGCYRRFNNNSGNPNFQVLIDNTLFFQAGGAIADGWVDFAFTYVAADLDALLQLRAQILDDDDYGIDNIVFAVSAKAGACCLPNGTCVTQIESGCESSGGVWRGVGTLCGDFNQNGADDVCETLGACQSDLNNDGEVGIEDFLKLLADWGLCFP